MRYHPYLAIVAFVDQSEEFRLGRRSQLERQNADSQAFETACKDYRDKLHSRERSIDPQFEHDPTDCLYKPYSCLAFGHTDNVIITLCDLIDPLFVLSQESELTFEQLSLAFCPDLGSLSVEPGELSWFEEPHEFIQATVNRGQGDLPMNETPLVFVSRLKIGGIAKLVGQKDITGPLLIAIIHKISSTLTTLISNSNIPIVQGCFPHIEPGDDASRLPFRCCIMDSQGVAEVTLLIRTNNYALPTLVLHQLRSLTLGEVFSSCPSATENAERFAKLVSNCITRADGESHAKEYSLKDNHVFVASYSTACMDPLTLQDGFSSLEGHVAVDVNWVVNPGHLEQVAKLIKDLGKVDLSTLRSMADFYHVRFGKFDLEYRLGTDEVPVIPIKDFLQTATSLCTSIKKLGNGKDETGILDMSCILSVPIPRSLSSQMPGSDHMPLAQLHAIISQNAGKSRTTADSSLVEDYRWFSRTQLEYDLKVIGVPRRLRDSIVYLYSNFLYCLNEPRLFDSVLDLTDAFRATFSSFETAARERRRVTPGDLKDLEMHIAAMEDACYYRQCHTLPQHELNDLAVHFRGGLNGLLNGADVYLKVGLGLIKWLAKSGTEPRLAHYADPMHLGALTELCYAMQPRCAVSSFALKYNHGLPHLKLNVGHVFHINEFVHYMHEMGHVMQALLGNQVDSERKLLAAYARQCDGGKIPVALKQQMTKCARLWTAEVFAEAFVFSFVCGFDRELYIAQYFAGFSAQPDRFPASSKARSTQKARRRLEAMRYVTLDRLLVAFFATSLFNPAWKECRTPEQWQSQLTQELEVFLQLARKHFNRYIYAQELYDHNVSSENSSGEEFWSFITERITRLTYAVVHSMREPIQSLAHYFRCYYVQLFEIVDDNLVDQSIQSLLSEVDRRVRQQIEKGVPIGSELVQDMLNKRPAGSDHVKLLSCSMLRSYLRLCLMDEEEGADYLAHRDAQGTLHNLKASSAAFMVDSGFAGYLCIRKSDRSSAVLWATAIHKSLQSLSVELRLRRLKSMLHPVATSRPDGPLEREES